MSTIERNALLAEAEGLLRKPNFTKEDRSKFDALLGMADALDGGARSNAVRRLIVDRNAVEMGKWPSDTRPFPQLQAQFLDYLRGGKEYLTHEQRAQGITTDSAGGYLVPQSFSERFAQAMKAADGLFAATTLFETKNGSATGYPAGDDSGVNAAIVAENVASTATETVFDTLTFGKTPLWRTGHVKASMELVQDSAFNLSGLLADAFAKRFARGIGASFVTTLLAGAPLGKTAASATAVTGDEVLDLVGSLDAAHQVGGTFCMNPATYLALLKLKASTGGDYLIKAERDAQGRPLVFGFPTYLCPSFPTMAAAAKVITFGDHSQFIRREVRGSLAVRTFVERYAELGQIGYEGYWRVDGGLLLPTNSPAPVKYLRNL